MLTLFTHQVYEGILWLQGTMSRLRQPTHHLPEQERRFPPEIEEMIFEYVLKEDILSVGNLVLTCKRLQRWLIPKAFEVVIITKSRTFPLKRFTGVHAKRYGHYVRHLNISKEEIGNVFGTNTTEARIYEGLAFFPNLIDIRMSWECYHSPIPALQRMPLTHLSLSVKDVVLILEKESRAFRTRNHTKRQSQLEPAFPTVTHLHTTTHLWSPYSQPHLDALGYHFPNVTHFTTDSIWTGDEPMIKLMLESLKKVEVFVGVWSGPLGINQTLKKLMELDNRVVTLTADSEMEWEDRARRRWKGKGRDMWSFAEAIVKGR